MWVWELVPVSEYRSVNDLGPVLGCTLEQGSVSERERLSAQELDLALEQSLAMEKAYSSESSSARVRALR